MALIPASCKTYGRDLRTRLQVRMLRLSSGILTLNSDLNSSYSRPGAKTEPARMRLESDFRGSTVGARQARFGSFLMDPWTLSMITRDGGKYYKIIFSIIAYSSIYPQVIIFVGGGGSRRRVLAVEGVICKLRSRSGSSHNKPNSTRAVPHPIGTTIPPP